MQENLGNANSKLDEKDKALQVVSTSKFFIVLINLFIKSHYKSTRDSHQQNYTRNREDTSLLFHSFFQSSDHSDPDSQTSRNSISYLCLFRHNQGPIVRLQTSVHDKLVSMREKEECVYCALASFVICSIEAAPFDCSEDSKQILYSYGKPGSVSFSGFAATSMSRMSLSRV